MAGELFRARFHLLRGGVAGQGFHLEFPLSPAATFGLLGPSGCGKTTALKVVAGLLRQAKGEVCFGDGVWMDTARKVFVPPQGRGAALLHQQPALFPHLTVAGNVRYGFAGGRDNGQLEPLLQTFGLAHLANRRAPLLSGGERQRVALARALASRPNLLLLDEPFNALDQHSRHALRPALKRWLAQAGIPALLVSHDPQDILALCSHCAVMREGGLVQQGPVEEVFSRPASQETAQLLGVECLLAGKIKRCDEGLALVAVGAFTIAALAPEPDGASKVGAEVWCAIRAGDITLLASATPASSARNAVPGVVRETTPQGWLVKVTLDCPGGVALTALVTRHAAQEMALRPGVAVTAMFKAPAVHLIER